jgi:hypothetical protein
MWTTISVAPMHEATSAIAGTIEAKSKARCNTTMIAL